jgi:hypothetical protein
LSACGTLNNGDETDVITVVVVAVVDVEHNGVDGGRLRGVVGMVGDMDWDEKGDAVTIRGVLGIIVVAAVVIVIGGGTETSGTVIIGGG